MFRIGSGYDSHRLATGRKCILCGIEIPAEKGPLGHSDADAPVHALIDALLGALALGDIGQHFPDTDEKYHGADSIELLRTTLQLPEFQTWHIANADLTIITEKPKLAPHVLAMRTCLANAMGLDVSAVSVKAKTAEKLGPVGAGEALEAFATVLLEHK